MCPHEYQREVRFLIEQSLRFRVVRCSVEKRLAPLKPVPTKFAYTGVAFKDGPGPGKFIASHRIGRADAWVKTTDIWHKLGPIGSYKHHCRRQLYSLGCRVMSSLSWVVAPNGRLIGISSFASVIRNVRGFGVSVREVHRVGKNISDNVVQD